MVRLDANVISSPPAGVTVGAYERSSGTAGIVHIGVGDFTHVVLHYAKNLGSTKMYLTDTAREEGDDLTAATNHMSEHSNLPVTVLR